MDDKIKTLRDALEWLDRQIREEAELDGEMTTAHAIQLGFIQSMLAKFPLRNCDVGTSKEQAKRMDAYCASYGERIGGSWRCDICPLCSIDRCELAWAQMPYNEEGGAK